MSGPNIELTALLVCPSRELAELFHSAIASSRTFEVLAELKSLPSQQTLEIRLRQLQPDVLLVDLSTDLEAAGELIRMVAGMRPAPFVIGLHTHNDSEVILQALRFGANEFLYAPFEWSAQEEAAARARRLKRPEPAQQKELGKIAVFASAKPGSGATTLATQTAFALKRHTNKRVLLADFDVTGGAISFFLKLNHAHSLIDVMEAGPLDPGRWAALTVSFGSVDVLPAPEAPYVDAFDQGRLLEVLQSMRAQYDWIVIDLPSIFSRISLLALSESDKAYLVSTSELPSLHLTRKAVSLLAQLGFGKDRFHVLVNRVNKNDGITGSEISKLFDCPVHASFPDDYFSLHRVITLGRPLATDCELGRAIDGLTSKLAGAASTERPRTAGAIEGKPAYSI